MPNLVCSGPGPHDPADGVLGSTTSTNPPAVLCPPCSVLKAQADYDAAAPQRASDANRTTLQQQAVTAMARLSQIMTQSTGLKGQTTAWTTAQRDAVLDAINDLAQVQRRIIRLVTNNLDGTN